MVQLDDLLFTWYTTAILTTNEALRSAISEEAADAATD
jgi:hypothetical protein